MQLLRPDVYVWLHIDDTYGHTQAAHAHKLRTSHVQLTQYKPHVDHCKNRWGAGWPSATLLFMYAQMATYGMQYKLHMACAHLLRSLN